MNGFSLTLRGITGRHYDYVLEAADQWAARELAIRRHNGRGLETAWVIRCSAPRP